MNRLSCVLSLVAGMLLFNSTLKAQIVIDGLFEDWDLIENNVVNFEDIDTDQIHQNSTSSHSQSLMIHSTSTLKSNSTKSSI